MDRKIPTLAIALLLLTALATGAEAATKGPVAKGTYASSHPRLSVYVDKPATKVQLYIGCFSSTNVAVYWDSPALSLKKDSFSFDKTTTLSTENGATFGQRKGTVLFTGKFSHGAFTGTAQIVGSSCPKSKYMAKFDKNGGGSGR